MAGNDAAIISTVDNDVNVVCFAAGTRIETPGGEALVEEIEVGDMVLTRDNGAQAVRAVLVRDLDFRFAPKRLQPILFDVGSLGEGRPNRPLCVSPQHRMLVADAGDNGVLVPAKALSDRKGVRVMRGKRRVTYYHLVFRAHEIIRANGTMTESFFPGPMALRAVPAEARAEIDDIFGRVDAARQVPAAAPMLSVRDGRQTSRAFG